MLPRRARERTFIILGTSHYGEPEKFGLTRKPFETPLGRTQIDLPMIDRLASRAASGVTVEDYCHSVEHSIEFQVLFLQWLYGPDIRIVPILCGAFVQSIYGRGMPEDDEGVARVLGELGEIAAAESERVAWVLGVDMAHIGRRYGDRVSARANEGHLAEVASRDAARNEQIAAGNASGFWDLVQQNRDDLRWCGSAPIYTFLKAVPQARGQVHRYEQWNIDEASVVTFAGISFTAA
jgi:AmmeMemoRadiSam system protein B